MTTKITVDAHAGCPVLVQIFDTFANSEPRTSEETVAPGEKKDFFVYDTRKLMITELPRLTATA